jgi:hypothetical protein
MSRSQIGAQGTDLGRRFAKRLPKDQIENAKRVTAEYEMLVADAVGYQRRAQLGFLGKSHLVNSLQWSLIAEGYSADFAKEIGGQLAVTLASTR